MQIFETPTRQIYILIIGNLAVYANINLTWLTNGIDLWSTYEVQSPMIEDPQTENVLTAIFDN